MQNVLHTMVQAQTRVSGWISQRDPMVRAQLASPPPFLSDVQVVHPCDRTVSDD
jgi:hypothetical protein